MNISDCENPQLEVHPRHCLIMQMVKSAWTESTFNRCVSLIKRGKTRRLDNACFLSREFKIYDVTRPTTWSKFQDNNKCLVIYTLKLSVILVYSTFQNFQTTKVLWYRP